ISHQRKIIHWHNIKLESVTNLDMELQKMKNWPLNIIKKWANMDYAAGQLEIGYCYYEGIGIEKDSKMAAKWYEKAANNANILAMYNLGLSYISGDGVDKNHNKAFELFKQSAEGGDSDGILMLGYC